jgi:hypothetical protein
LIKTLTVLEQVKMKRHFLTMLAATAISGFAMFPTIASAKCGLLNCVGKAIGLGSITQPLDDLNREIKNRSGESSFYNQVMGNYTQGFNAAAPAATPTPDEVAAPSAYYYYQSARGDESLVLGRNQ